jgi:cell cycle checkpoint protein
MAPPAKRRKRAIVDDDSDDDDIRKNNGSQEILKRFLSSPSKPPSPDKKPATATTQLSTASPSPSPIRKRATRPGTKLAKSPSTSPVKTRAAAKRKQDDAKEGSADLRTLFSRQAQRNSQSQSSQLAGRGTTDSAASSTSSLFLGTGASGSSYQLSTGARRSQLDDIISDPILEQIDDDDDDDVPLVYSASNSVASSFAERARAAQKRFAGNNAAGSGGSGTTSRGGAGTEMAAPAGGQRFLKTARSNGTSQATSTASASTAAPRPDEDSRPWSERFAPVSLDELAVNKRKVQDVRKWLEEVFTGRARQRLLVLKGPAGAGKTTTVRLLARDMRCKVLEWRNPGSTYGVPGQAYQSAAAQFEEFLGRGNKFGQLDVESDDGATPPPQQQVVGPPPPGSAADGGRRLMLVEEFPNTFMRSSVGLMGFRDAVLQFLAANVPPMGWGYSQEPATPVIMVISETLLTTTSASADSFTAHRLLGPEILKHPGTTVIEFKPIAPTFLTKALELVVQKEARKSGRRRTPGLRVLQRLGEVGDIRNAISSLEFLCAKGDAEADWGAKVAFTKPKRAPKDAPALTKGEQESLELVSQREATLGIFHAVGKVVYNKRTDFPSGSEEAAAEAALPSYMSHLARPKKSEVTVESLIDEIGTDTHTFISALHENYPLSCEQTGPSDPNSPIDYINGCLDYLSDSDLLYPSWDIFFGGARSGHSYGGAVTMGYTGKDSGSHMLRQDEIAFQVAVRAPPKKMSHDG